MQESLAEALTAWLWPGLSALVAVGVAHVVYRVLLAIVRRVTRAEAVPRIFLDAAARALGVALALLVLHFGLAAAPQDLPGLGVLQRERPELLDGDLAILGEPTDGFIEAGCQGTLRIRVHAVGTRAHSPRRPRHHRRHRSATKPK